MVKNSTPGKLARDILAGVANEPRGVVDFDARVQGWWIPRDWQPDGDDTAPESTATPTAAIELARVAMETADAHVLLERLSARLAGTPIKVRSRWSVEAIRRRSRWAALVSATTTLRNHSVTAKETHR